MIQKHEALKAVDDRLKDLKRRSETVSQVAMQASEFSHRALTEPELVAEYLKRASETLSDAVKVAEDVGRRAVEVEVFCGAIGSVVGLNVLPEFLLHQTRAVNDAATHAAKAWASIGFSSSEIFTNVRKAVESSEKEDKAKKPLSDTELTPVVSIRPLCPICGERQVASGSSICSRCHEDTEHGPDAA